MKNQLLFLFTATISSFASAQDSTNDPLTYSNVIPVDSIPSSELYVRSRSWFANTYNNSKEVIQLDDKENGKIIGKGAMKYNSSNIMGSTSGWVNYTITVEVKDGRYRYEVTNYDHEATITKSGGSSFGLITKSITCPYKIGMAGKGWKNRIWDDIKETINIKTNGLVESLTLAMTKPEKSKNDNW